MVVVETHLLNAIDGSVTLTELARAGRIRLLFNCLRVLLRRNALAIRIPNR